MFSGMADLRCITIELAMGFSKKIYLVMLSSPTQIFRSNVGSLPPGKSSPDSIVRTKKSQMEFIMFFMISTVFCKPVIPFLLSSVLHAVENLRLPSVHLQPSLTEYIHSLMSSMYLAFCSSVRLFLAMRESSFSSHHSITILAMQQVDLSPMGPPVCCKKNFPPNSYTCVLNSTKTAIFMTVAIISRFSLAVSLTFGGNDHWFWSPE